MIWRSTIYHFNIFKDKLTWARVNSPSKEEDFRDLHNSVSIVNTFRSIGVEPWVLSLAIPILIYLLGLTLSIAQNRMHEFLTNPFPFAFTADLIIAVSVGLWIDQRIGGALVEIQDVFQESEETYYHFMGHMIERAYEQFPWAPRPGGRLFHLPTTFIYCLGILTLLTMAFFLPNQMSSFTLTDWRNVPSLMKSYYIFIYLIIGFIVLIVLWGIITIAIFMGWRVSKFDIILDPTRRHIGLGLRPYSKMVLHGALGILFCVTIAGAIVIQSPSNFFLLGYIIFTTFPIIWVLGSHYGLYITIRDSKKRQLEELREEIDGSKNIYEMNDSGDFPEEDISTLFRIIEEVESFPNWPFDIERFIELVILVIASNTSIVLRTMV